MDNINFRGQRDIYIYIYIYIIKELITKASTSFGRLKYCREG